MSGQRNIVALGDINYDESAIRILLHGESGDTAEEVRRRARAVQKRAQHKAPFRTGRLRYSISVNTMTVMDGYVAEVTADAPYSLMVEFGRKAIDLKGTRHYLNWQSFAGEVFTQTAAEVPATNFMSEALDAAGDG